MKDKISDSTKVTLTLKQVRELVKECSAKSPRRVKEASKFNRDNVADGNAKVEEFIANLRQTGQDIEKVAELEGLVQKMTVEAVQKSKQAKNAASVARAAEKDFSKPLDDAAKRMAEIIGSHDDIFFSAQEKARKVGILLTRKLKVMSQKDANKAILERLTDPEFIAGNEDVKKLGESMIALLESAKRTLKAIGLFDPDAEQETWSAALYSQDDADGTMAPLKESFFGKIKDMFVKAADWFRGLFMPRYERKEVQYSEALDHYTKMLNDFAYGLEQTRA